MRSTLTSFSRNVSGSSPGCSRSTFSSGEGGFSGATRRFLMSLAIDLFLERLDADAVHGIDEALCVAVTMLEVAADELLDDVGDVGAGEGRADHLAERRGGLVTTDLDLVPLLAVLVDAE